MFVMHRTIVKVICRTHCREHCIEYCVSHNAMHLIQPSISALMDEPGVLPVILLLNFAQKKQLSMDAT